jgi:hypothetical protein
MLNRSQWHSRPQEGPELGTKFWDGLQRRIFCSNTWQIQSVKQWVSTCQIEKTWKPTQNTESHRLGHPWLKYSQKSGFWWFRKVGVPPASTNLLGPFAPVSLQPRAISFDPTWEMSFCAGYQLVRLCSWFQRFCYSTLIVLFQLGWCSYFQDGNGPCVCYTFPRVWGVSAPGHRMRHGVRSARGVCHWKCLSGGVSGPLLERRTESRPGWCMRQLHAFIKLADGVQILQRPTVFLLLSCWI